MRYDSGCSFGNDQRSDIRNGFIARPDLPGYIYSEYGSQLVLVFVMRTGIYKHRIMHVLKLNKS